GPVGHAGFRRGERPRGLLDSGAASMGSSGIGLGNLPTFRFGRFWLTVQNREGYPGGEPPGPKLLRFHFARHGWREVISNRSDEGPNALRETGDMAIHRRLDCLSATGARVSPPLPHPLRSRPYYHRTFSL